MVRRLSGVPLTAAASAAKGHPVQDELQEGKA